MDSRLRGNDDFGLAANWRAHPPWSLGVLAALGVTALGLRLWQLDSCFWFDEVLTVVDFVRPPLGQIVTSFPSQNQHMLFSVLAH
jgi:hypothetical protein